MGSDITEEERRLIDEAVAAGKVSNIPYGVRTIGTDDFIYSGTKNRLVHADAAVAKRRLKNSIRWGKGFKS